jgi:ATP/ADP translocase
VKQEVPSAPKPIMVSVLTTAIIIVSVTVLAVLIFLQRAKITSLLQNLSKNKKHEKTEEKHKLNVKTQ